MKKLSKSKVTDIVWSLWEGYESDQDEFKEWGSYVPETDRDERKTKVVDYVVSIIPVTRQDVESVLQSIEHMKECRVYDERDVGEEVKEWVGELHVSQGKKDSERGYEILKSKIDELVKTYDDSWDDDVVKLLGHKYTDVVPLLMKKEEWEKNLEKVLTDMGIPHRECNCLIHFGRISKFDDKYKDSRTEVYERLLRKNSKHVKI